MPVPRGTKLHPLPPRVPDMTYLLQASSVSYWQEVERDQETGITGRRCLFNMLGYRKGGHRTACLQKSMSHIYHLNQGQNDFSLFSRLKWFLHNSFIFCRGSKDTINSELMTIASQFSTNYIHMATHLSRIVEVGQILLQCRGLEELRVLKVLPTQWFHDSFGVLVRTQKF